MTAQIKLKVQRKAIVKLKLLPKFPYNVIGTSGVVVTKGSSAYTFSLDPVAVLAVIGLTPGVNVQAQDSDLQALADNVGTGIWTVTGAGAGSVRTITGTANEITLTNGSGVAGNPTVSLPTALTFTGKTITGGTYASVASVNKVAITAPATGATLTIPDGVTMTGPAASGTVMTLGNTESVTGAKTFANNGGLRIIGSSTGVTLFNSANSGASNFTLTFPAATDTLAALAQTQSWTGANTFANTGGLRVLGSSTGSTLFASANAGASNFTLTLPALTDTFVTKTSTDTLTNKTFDTAGTGNSLSINGVAVTANTGTGAVARAAGPTFTTPALGVATATTLNGNTFTTGTYTLTGVAGKTLTFNNSLTLAGTDATTLTFQGTDTYVGRATTDTLTNKSISGSTNTLSNILPSSLANQAAFTFIGNNTSGLAIPTAVSIPGLTSKASPAAADLVLIADSAASNAWKQTTVSALSSAGSVGSIDTKTGAFTTGNGLDSTAGNIIELTAARRTLPTIQNFTTGTAATYTTPANVLWIEVLVIGGGGGGGGGNNGTPATAGGASSFSTLTANGGGGGVGAGGNAGGAGGTASGGNIFNAQGHGGGIGSGVIATVSNGAGGNGGASYLGSGGAGTSSGGAVSAGNYGGGGGGGSATTSGTIGSGGGGAGGAVKHIINSPAATYTYTVGASGAGAAAGAGGSGGGNGAGGFISVIEHYGS